MGPRRWSPLSPRCPWVRREEENEKEKNKKRREEMKKKKEGKSLNSTLNMRKQLCMSFELNQSEVVRASLIYLMVYVFSRT